MRQNGGVVARCRVALVSVIAACLLATASACGPTPEPAPQSTVSASPGDATPTAPTQGSQTNPLTADRVKDGGVLKLGVTSMPDSWNPLEPSDPTRDILWDILSPRLFTREETGEFLWDPTWLASQPITQLVDDATTVTYHLNPAAKWTNGQPMVAEDFRATWLLCAQSTAQYCQGKGFDRVTNVTAGADASEVIVSYDGPYPDWPLTFQRGPLPQSVSTDESVDWSTLMGRSGWFSGPFTVASQTSTLIILTHNPLWWGEKQKLDAIWITIPADQNWTVAFTAGDIDSFWIEDPDVYARVENLDGIQVRRDQSPLSRHLVINMVDGALADPVVRQAVRLTLDRLTLGRSDLAGWRWTLEPLSNPIFRVTQDPYVALEPWKPDIKSAQSLLDQADYVVGEDGYRSKAGVPLVLSFLVPQGDTLAENEGFGVRAQLAKVGIAVHLREVGEAEAAAAMASGDFVITGVTLTDDSPLESAFRFTSPNISGYQDTIVDGLVEQAMVAQDQKAQDEFLADAANEIWLDTPLIPLYEFPELLLTRPALANLGPDGLGTTIWEHVGWAS